VIGLWRWFQELRRERARPSPEQIAVFEERLAALRGADDATRHDLACAAVGACRIRPGLVWRDGLRRVLPELDGLDGSDGVALRGLVLAHLGEAARAFALLDTLPADHPGGCAARAVAYAAVGDEERAASARNAAAELTRPRRER
jgi:hypothetical protein